MVFVVSDFATGDFEKPMRHLRQRHDTVAITVVDPRERDLPDIGFIELEDAETGEIVIFSLEDTKEHVLKILEELGRDMPIIELSRPTQATEDWFFEEQVQSGKSKD